MSARASRQRTRSPGGIGLEWPWKAKPSLTHVDHSVALILLLLLLLLILLHLELSLLLLDPGLEQSHMRRVSSLCIALSRLGRLLLHDRDWIDDGRSRRVIVGDNQGERVMGPLREMGHNWSRQKAMFVKDVSTCDTDNLNWDGVSGCLVAKARRCTFIYLSYDEHSPCLEAKACRVRGYAALSPFLSSFAS